PPGLARAPISPLEKLCSVRVYCYGWGASRHSRGPGRCGAALRSGGGTPVEWDYQDLILPLRGLAQPRPGIRRVCSLSQTSRGLMTRASFAAAFAASLSFGSMSVANAADGGLPVADGRVAEERLLGSADEEAQYLA